MSMLFFYALIGVGLFTLGLLALVVQPHLLQKILALNVMGSGVFLLLVALGGRSQPVVDVVPQAMVITGIVVAVSATAMALTLMLNLSRSSPGAQLPEDQSADS